MTKIVTPIKLTFTNLKYQVRVKSTRSERQYLGAAKYRDETILKEVSGYMLPGQTHYIMGASGAGKTTLLNALSGRIRLDKKCRLTGDRTLNDIIPLDSKSFSKFGAYVMQDDMLFEYFTVREALQFAAKLKLSIPDSERNERVNEIINELGLQNCQETQIGSELRKTISGGERKRTSIGVELVTDPSLLVLDEPTSGLDSFKATGLVRTLHDLARSKGKTIIATIHQPSSEAFVYFDKLFLLADGHMVFQGTAMRCQKYFKKLGCPLERFKNPADSFMKLLAVSYPKTEEDKEKIDSFVNSYKKLNEPRVLAERQELSFTDLTEAIQNYKIKRPNVCRQFLSLLGRNIVGLWRNPAALIGRIVISIFVAATQLTIFW